MDDSPLLLLPPAELRNDIYRLALEQPEAIKMKPHSTSSNPRVIDYKVAASPHNNTTLLALTTTCKTLRTETLALFFAVNAFEFYWDSAARHFLRRLPSGITRIGSIKIDVDWIIRSFEHKIYEIAELASKHPLIPMSITMKIRKESRYPGFIDLVVHFDGQVLGQKISPPSEVYAVHMARVEVQGLEGDDAETKQKVARKWMRKFFRSSNGIVPWCLAGIDGGQDEVLTRLPRSELWQGPEKGGPAYRHPRRLPHGWYA